MGNEKNKSSEKELKKKLELFLSAIDDVYPSYKKLMMRSFLRGLFIGLGTTIGVSVVLTALTFVLGQLRLIPTFDQFIPETELEQSITE